MRSLSFVGLAILVATCVQVPVAKADLLQDVKAKRKLVCGTLTDVEPLGFTDPKTRQVVGFDVDTCAAIAKHLGVQLEHKGLTVEARIPELTLGRVDIVAAALGYTKERAQQIAYTHAHYQAAIRVLVKASSGITTLAQLNGKKVSATQGSTPELFARRKLPGATIMTFQDVSTAFLALQQDKVSGFAISEFGSLRFKQQSGGQVKSLDEPLAWEATGLGVRKGEPAFLAEVNHILEAMEQSGELDRLWDKWYGPNTRFNVKREKRLTPIEKLE